MPSRDRAGLSVRRVAIMASLIIAGEAIFILPFVFARIFRPTMLDVFGLTNFELGLAFSVYGIVALAAYFFGGPLADRYPARNLMSMALAGTALLGILFTRTPTGALLTLLYGAWGLTTILLFWAAMLRATRQWGGAQRQGIAYGLLDGGRGLFAALLATASVSIFAMLLPVDAADASPSEKAAALRTVIWIFSGVTMATAVLIWVVIPARDEANAASVSHHFRVSEALGILRHPTIWLQALVVLCAYVGYKATDDFSLFARDVFGYDDVLAARIGTISFWARPIAAIAAGVLADRYAASGVISVGFTLMAIGCGGIAMGLLQPGIGWMLITVIVFTSLAIYAIRGVYFALLAEGRVPLRYTGTAIGIVSVVGFTPDIFMGPWMGHLLDTTPGAGGHQDVFGVVALFAIIGLIASMMFRHFSRAGAVGVT
ncbi:MAG: MFS transporter [Saprospiraceae bacterium]|nr:MFS transporter [Saprospiraceae bacterium]